MRAHITVRIRRHCPDNIRGAGLTVFGNPAPRDLGGNNSGFVSDRFGLSGACGTSFC